MIHLGHPGDTRIPDLVSFSSSFFLSRILSRACYHKALFFVLLRDDSFFRGGGEGVLYLEVIEPMKDFKHDNPSYDHSYMFLCFLSPTTVPNALFDQMENAIKINIM